MLSHVVWLYPCHSYRLSHQKISDGPSYYAQKILTDDFRSVYTMPYYLKHMRHDSDNETIRTLHLHKCHTVDINPFQKQIYGKECYTRYIQSQNVLQYGQKHVVQYVVMWFRLFGRLYWLYEFSSGGLRSLSMHFRLCFYKI